MSSTIQNGKAVYYDYTPEKYEPVHTQRSFYVYAGDKSFPDFSEALEDTARIGLKAVVDAHGADLLIVNPASGHWETETEDDARALLNELVRLLKEKGEGYVWYWQRDLITMVGDRSGADFISRWLTAAFPAPTIVEGFSLKLMAQSVTLLHPSAPPCGTGRYLPEAEEKLLPAFLAGGTKEAVEGYKKLNRTVGEGVTARGGRCHCWESGEKNALVAVSENIDEKTMEDAYELVQSTFRRRNLGDEPLASVRRPNLAQLGIKKIEHNEYLDSDEPETLYTWYEYLPDDLGENERLPLIMVLHGGGENGQYIMEMTRWAFLVKKERLICAALTNHSVEKDRVLLTHLLKTLPIDTERMYATGFSMGGVSSSGFGLVDSRLAGVAPQDGVILAADEYAPEKMPIFYIAGINDTPFPKVTRNEEALAAMPALGQHASKGKKGPPPPSDAQKRAGGKLNAGALPTLFLNSVADILNTYFVKNDVPFLYWSPTQFTEENGIYGVQLEHKTIKEDTIGGHKIVLGDLPSRDGRVYVRLGYIEGLGHDVHPDTAELIWDFLRRFSRKPDGSISVN